MVPTKDQIVQWILLHRMELILFSVVIYRIILTFFAILFTIYVFVPTKSNWTVPIRLICVMLLLAAIAFLDYASNQSIYYLCHCWCFASSDKEHLDRYVDAIMNSDT